MDRNWIRERLASHHPRPPRIPPGLKDRLRPAAVLVPLFQEEGEWRVLLTRRTESLRNHKGQVALPGGAQEPGDPDLVATALREAFEEIGLPPEVVQVVGALSPQPVISGYLVTPVVGIIPPRVRLHPAKDEIARVFTVPLAWLADDQRVHLRYREWEGVDYPIYVYEPYDGEVIWGLTARILRELVQVLIG